jgi:dTDP-4-dehydrorhamnose reductase
MHILITGGNGQLGQALQKTLTKHTTTAVDLPDHDITNPQTVHTLLQTHQPNLIINAAAYTNVDGCVSNPDLAYQVNAQGPRNLALACLDHDIPLVHISTNEVFRGNNPAGYDEWMPLNPHPRNAYGRSKAAGEFNVRHILPRHYIVRTAWLYASTGRNFIHAILNRARETGQLRVVTDEIGNPTWANDLAQAITQLIETGQYGTYHFVNEGACSRWAFANEIARLAGLEGVRNEPILSSEFKRASTPPPFGALHNNNGRAVGIVLRPWQEALAEFVAALE